MGNIAHVSVSPVPAYAATMGAISGRNNKKVCSSEYMTMRGANSDIINYDLCEVKKEIRYPNYSDYEYYHRRNAEPGVIGTTLLIILAIAFFLVLFGGLFIDKD